MLARRETVHDGQIEIHHCVGRCVRHAYLCGFDPYSQRDYEHRRGWIEDRLKFLAGAFGVDVITHSIMTNQFHVILRTRPDRAARWPALEVARRWRRVFPKDGTDPAALGELSRDDEEIEKLRGRLGTLSWFMRCLDEYISRKANKEDKVRGHFWEERFQNQAILDEASLLACMAYVDLKPIRAAMAETLESSAHTGVRQRIVARQAKARVRALAEQRRARAKSSGSPDSKVPLTVEQGRLLQEQMAARHTGRWLCPIDARRAPAGGRAGVLAMTTDEYLELLDWTGREIRSHKRGAIPAHLAPVLKRLALDVEGWVNTVQRYGSLFWRVAGRVESILAAAQRAGRRWFKGLRAGQAIYSRQVT